MIVIKMKDMYLNKLIRKIIISLLILCFYLCLKQIPTITLPRIIYINSLGFYASKQQIPILCLGVLPYILSVTILNFLLINQNLPFYRWSQQGIYGKNKLKKLTYGISFFIGIFLSYSILTSQKPYLVMSQKSSLLATAFIWAFTSLIFTLIIQFLNQYSLTDNISLIVFFNILYQLVNTFKYLRKSAYFSVVTQIFIIIIFFLLCLFAFLFQTLVYKEPVFFTNHYFNLDENNKTYLNFYLNPSSTYPIIFTVSIFMILKKFSKGLFSLNNWVSIIFYLVLISLFTYLYAFIQYNPIQISQNLKNLNGNIANKTAGEETVLYLGKILLSLSFIGSIYLILMSLIPIILFKTLRLNDLNTSVLTGSNIIIFVNLLQDFFLRIKSEISKIAIDHPFINKKDYPQVKIKDYLNQNIVFSNKGNHQNKRFKN